MFTFKSSIYDKTACFLVLDHIQQFPSLNHVLVYDLRKCQNFQKVIIKKAFLLLIFSIKATFRNLVLILIYLFLIQLLQMSAGSYTMSEFHKQCVIFTCGWILVCKAKTSWILWEITREQHSWTPVLEDRPPHLSRASLILHEGLWTWELIKCSVKSRPTSFSTWLHAPCVAYCKRVLFLSPVI